MRASLHTLGASLGLLTCLSLSLGVARALEVPTLVSRVTDETGKLDAASRSLLEGQLKAYEQATGHQFALLMVPSLDGDSLEDYAMRVVEQWKLGQAGKDDGLLLLVALNDRKIRVEVGYGLEGDIPDVLGARVTRDVIGPAFRGGNFAVGIEQAFAVLMRAGAGGEDVVSLNARQRKAPTLSAEADDEDMGWLGAFVLVLFVISMMFRRRRGHLGMGGGMYYGGGGGGFSSGGGGGFSGGGGGFGGGGASGSW